MKGEIDIFYGVFVPLGVFLVSFLSTYLLYRYFSKNK